MTNFGRQFPPDEGEPARESFALRIEIIRQEYAQADDTVRAYDDHVFRIKGWAITACSAAVLFAINNHRPLMYAVGIFAAGGFWLIDAYTKSIQRLFITRSEKIEAFFRGPQLAAAVERKSTEGLKIPTVRELMTISRRAKISLLLREMTSFYTYFLYVALIAGTLLLLAIQLA